MNEAVDKMKRDVARIKQEQGEQESGAPNASGSPDAKDEQQAGKQATDEQQAGEQQGAQDEQQGEQEQPQQLSEHEQAELDRALNSGWKPLEEFQGDERDFVDVREWNRTVALYKRLDREREEQARLKKQIEEFNKRVKNVMEVTKAKTIAELEAQRDQAIEDADHKEVRRIDKEIKQTEEDLTVPDDAPQQEPLRPEVEDWMEANTWFERDKDMTDFAISFQQAQIARMSDPKNPTSAELTKALKRVDRALRNEFPDRFRRQPRYQAQSLERGDLKPKPRKFTFNDLNEQEKKVLEHIERLPGGMSREEYIQACADMRQAK